MLRAGGVAPFASPFVGPSAADMTDGVDVLDIVRLRVLGRALAVDNRPGGSDSLILLESESIFALLALGDKRELMLAISRSLLCCSRLGL